MQTYCLKERLSIFLWWVVHLLCQEKDIQMSVSEKESNPSYLVTVMDKLRLPPINGQAGLTSVGFLSD